MLFKLILIICLGSVLFVVAQDSEGGSQVPAGSVVSGRVYFEDTGRPVRRASITLISRGMIGPNPFAITDSGGNFKIGNVRAGTYFAVVNSPGVVSPMAYGDPSRNRQDGFDEAVSGFHPIVVSGTGSIEVNIPVTRGGAISGKVTYADGDPAIGIKIEVMKKTDDGFMPVMPNLSSVATLYNGGAGVYQTDDRGYFRSAGLPAGKYIVRITEKGKHSGGGEHGYYRDSGIIGSESLLTMYYPDALDASLAKVVDIELGQENPEIAIVIPDRELRSISGKIVSAKGKIPVRGAYLTLTRKGGEDVSIINDSDSPDPAIFSDDKGEWSFEELPKGTYEIKVVPNNGGFDERENTFGFSMNNSNGYGGHTSKKGVEFAQKIQEFTLDDKDLSGLVIELFPGGSISGKVTVYGEEFPGSVEIAFLDQNDHALASTSAWVYEMRDEERTEKFISTDFRISQVPSAKGSLRISISDDRFYVKSATLRANDLLAGPLELKEGQVIQGLEIVLGTDVGTIKGKILTDKDGPAMREALLLVPADKAKRKPRDRYKSIVTSGTGEFEARVAPGEYAVIFKNQLGNKKGQELYKAVEEKIKDAVKVKIGPGVIQKITLKREKVPGP